VTRPVYELTVHAKAVIEARGIRLEWLERVLSGPERTEADIADPELQHAIGRIAEHGDRHLRVVYNGFALPWRIVTAYFDRALRDKQ
jgi:hypothetical protein